MNYEVYHIPSNFTDAGRIMGLFELRNLVEAVILTVPALYLCIAFLPFGLTAKIQWEASALLGSTMTVWHGGWVTGGNGGEDAGSFYFEGRSERESKGLNFWRRGEVRRRWRYIPRQHSGMAAHQEYHRRSCHYKGWSICEDTWTSAGQYLFEVP